MSEKLDELIVSVNEIKQNRRIDTMLMRGFMVACGAIMIYFITFMNTTSGRLSRIEAVLATTENIASLKKDIQKVRTDLHNEMGVYISFTSYLEIEKARSEAVVDAIVDFGIGRIVGLREEDLEYYRRRSVEKINRSLKPGVTRGNGIQSDKNNL